MQQRIELLERDLREPQVRISAYHDMPFAIFRYDPEEELDARSEIRLLSTRLTNAGRMVRIISLAELMRESMALALGEDMESLYQAEETMGVAVAVQTVHQILTQVYPLDELVAERLHAFDPANCVAFLTRAEALFPAYRTSALLDRLFLRGIEVPTVLFYPGDLEGVNGLRFMGVFDAEHNYRPRIY